jgi:diguanylate cyclase (GGDEF)-like protein
VLDRRAPLILKDAQANYEAFREPPNDHIRGWLGVPLIFQDRIIGLIALDSNEPDRFTENHARLASAFASQVAAALENARLYEETRRLSITDPLTGIGKRRHFIELAQREFQRSHRYQRPLSLIMLDLDHFKVVNDTYGHLVGDKVLRAIAKLCENNLRESDIIGRYGGEEFLILLPETPGYESDPNKSDEHTAKAVAERLRKMVESTPTQTAQGKIPITISLGIAELTGDIDDLDTLIDRADQALYQAKQGGRNQSVVWES